MNCQKCGAIARMSRRRGLKEGIFDRLMLRAVYRCLDCGLRYKIYAPHLAFKKTRKGESPFEYIGYGDERDKGKVQTAIIVIAIAVIIVAAAVQMPRTDDGGTIRVDSNNKRIVEPPTPVKSKRPARKN